MSYLDVVQDFSVSSQSKNIESDYSFPLIEREYDAADAGEPIMKLVRANQQYHNILALREFELYSKVSSETEDARKQLELLERETFDVLKSAREQGQKVKLEAEIRIILA